MWQNAHGGLYLEPGEIAILADLARQGVPGGFGSPLLGWSRLSWEWCGSAAGDAVAPALVAPGVMLVVPTGSARAAGAFPTKPASSGAPPASPVAEPSRMRQNPRGAGRPA